MGLGVGVDCECCGRQLAYGQDDEEIVRHTEIVDGGRQVVTLRPVLCHDCSAARSRTRRPDDQPTWEVPMAKFKTGDPVFHGPHQEGPAGMGVVVAVAVVGGEDRYRVKFATGIALPDGSTQLKPSMHLFAEGELRPVAE